MKRLGYYVCIIVISYVLLGCGTDTGVVKIGEDTFKIYKRAGTGFHGGTAIRARGISEAKEFCECQGKVFKKLSVEGSHPPYILGNFPKMTLEFMCLDSNDSRLIENAEDQNVGTEDNLEAKMKTLKKLHSHPIENQNMSGFF